MSNFKKVRGVGWDVGAIGNAVWGGAKLADVLELVGVPKLSRTTLSGGKHVEFVSIDRCKEESGGPYKGSIPLSQATNPEADVLLAYEMNGQVSVETLESEEPCQIYAFAMDHGYPLRVIVPGAIGARSVKWMDSVNVIAEECQGFFMQKDYKMFPPSVDWDNINWSSRRPLMDFPVQSVICSLEEVNVLKDGKVTVKGYAVSGGGSGIERVDISADGGKSWVEAMRFQKTGVPYVADACSSDKWAWVFFEARVEVLQHAEIVAKAITPTDFLRNRTLRLSAPRTADTAFPFRSQMHICLLCAFNDRTLAPWEWKVKDVNEFVQLPQAFRSKLQDSGWAVGRSNVHQTVTAADGTIKVFRLQIQGQSLITSFNINWLSLKFPCPLNSEEEEEDQNASERGGSKGKSKRSN